MIILINGGPALDRFGPTKLVGRLVSPRSGHRIRNHETWAADNDAYKAWDEKRFVRMLNVLDTQDTIRPNCLFVTAPDVVCDAKATMDRFWDWRPEITGRGFPIALVAQDGCEDIDLPWDAFESLFLGGSTAWKLSAAAGDLSWEARQRQKWVHMGRVNSQKRLKIAYQTWVDSVDGTGWSMFPDKYLKRDVPFLAKLIQQGRLEF